jgi:hypothetical protein
MKRILLVLSLALGGCTYSIHDVQVSDFSPYEPIERGEIVKASADQFTIMGFVTQTDYVDEAYRKLIEACPGGTVSGITTQISTSHGFFSWHNKALMQGLCLKSGSRKS